MSTKGDQMKFLSVKFVILLLLVLALGCSAIIELTKDGIGQPISTVIDRYGLPSHGWLRMVWVGASIPRSTG